MSEQNKTQLMEPSDTATWETIARELDLFFEGCEFSDILCDGKCATCLQREWCLLTPVSRYVK